jgi:hypothetical protein
VGAVAGGRNSFELALEQRSGARAALAAHRQRSRYCPTVSLDRELLRKLGWSCPCGEHTNRRSHHRFSGGSCPPMSSLRIDVLEASFGSRAARSPALWPRLRAHGLPASPQ